MEVAVDLSATSVSGRVVIAGGCLPFAHNQVVLGSAILWRIALLVGGTPALRVKGWADRLPFQSCLAFLFGFEFLLDFAPPLFSAVLILSHGSSFLAMEGLGVPGNENEPAWRETGVSCQAQ
jgi:hypothetical protein